jgi:hypothetical protein
MKATNFLLSLLLVVPVSFSAGEQAGALKGVPQFIADPTSSHRRHGEGRIASAEIHVYWGALTHTLTTRDTEDTETILLNASAA